MTEPTEKHRVEVRPDRVWITWDDRYVWEIPETGGDEYLRVVRGDDAEKQARELTRISERLDRLQVDQETLLELASTDVERAYELTIKDLIEDARYLLAAIRSRPVGESDARELVERYLTWMPTAELHDMQIPALVEAIITYTTAHGEKQWRDAIEVAAQTCEGLVTFTAEHGCKCEPCAWCKALETAASAIRALLDEEKKDDQR